MGRPGSSVAAVWQGGGRKQEWREQPARKPLQSFRERGGAGLDGFERESGGRVHWLWGMEGQGLGVRQNA